MSDAELWEKRARQMESFRVAIEAATAEAQRAREPSPIWEALALVGHDDWICGRDLIKAVNVARAFDAMPRCGDVDPVFGEGIGPVCNEPEGHTGDHVATDRENTRRGPGGLEVSRWENKGEEDQ